MQKLQYEQVRYANEFVPAATTLSHGHQSEPCSLCECADLLNSYMLLKYFVFQHSVEEAFIR